MASTSNDFPGPMRVRSLNDIAIGSAVFAQTDQHVKTRTSSPHLASCVRCGLIMDGSSQVKSSSLLMQYVKRTLLQ